MAISDYLRLVEHLRGRTTVVLVLCRGEVADDPAFPDDAPEIEEFVLDWIPSLPPRTRIRVAAVAAEMALAEFERECDGDAPRQALRATLRSLSGEWIEPEVLVSHAMHTEAAGTDAIRTSEAAAGWAYAIAGVAEAAAQVAATELENLEPGGDVQPPATDLDPGMADVIFAASDLRPAFLHEWWRRCRACVPIANLATAAISWCDLRLLDE